MFKTSYQICTVFGIPIRVDISLIILAFMMLGQWGNPLFDILSCVLLLLSIVLHELGHSLVAMGFGCRVCDITLMLIGGAARLETMPRKAWQELLVALAGPVVSLSLGLAGLWMFAPLGFSPSGGVVFRSMFSKVCYYSFGFGNLMLFSFNLIPAFPMDGGRVLRSILQQFFMSRLKATWVASRIGRFIAVLFVIGMLMSLFGYSIPFVGGLNSLLIAFFIYTSADREYRMVLAEEGEGGRGGGGGRFPNDPPFDDGKAVVSPPPYGRHSTRVDVHKE